MGHDRSTVKAKFQSGPHHAASKVVNETLRRNFTSADSGLGNWAASPLMRTRFRPQSTPPNGRRPSGPSPILPLLLQSPPYLSQWKPLMLGFDGPAHRY